MKTAREWFKSLPKNLEEAALKNVYGHEYLDRVYDTLHESMNNTLLWSGTFKHWVAVYSYAQKAESLSIILTPDLDWPYKESNGERSLNYGTQDGKADYTVIFDDFPHCWVETEYVSFLIDEDYEGLFRALSKKVSFGYILAARQYGMKKYSRDNWKASIGTESHDSFMLENKKSIYRHLVAFSDGEKIDSESGCKHLAMIMLRCMIAIEYKNFRKENK